MIHCLPPPSFQKPCLFLLSSAPVPSLSAALCLCPAEGTAVSRAPSRSLGWACGLSSVGPCPPPPISLPQRLRAPGPPLCIENPPSQPHCQLHHPGFVDLIPKRVMHPLYGLILWRKPHLREWQNPPKHRVLNQCSLLPPPPFYWLTF